MSHKPDKQFNTRTYQGQLERELIVGGLLVGLVVGGVLIETIWGAAVLYGALGCFALFLGLLFAVWLFLQVLEFAARD